MVFREAGGENRILIKQPTWVWPMTGPGFPETLLELDGLTNQRLKTITNNFRTGQDTPGWTYWGQSLQIWYLIWKKIEKNILL